MSYEGLINVPFVPSNFGQSYCSGIIENCSLGNVDSSLDYRVSNCDCELRAFMSSPWLKQYRSMCVELGRSAHIYEGNVWKPSLTTVHDNSRARALRHTNPPNSVGQKVFSFLREAFRKTSEEVKYHESSQIRRLEKHKDIRHKKESGNARAQKKWHPTSHWISKKKSKSKEITKPLGVQRPIIESTKILQIKHSGTRSADYSRRHQNVLLERARTSTPILTSQANSQNSTPSARPSALITEKSRDGISKRTRFSLHPSTCNAPPDLIRPRRDSEETSMSGSSIPEFLSRSARSSSHKPSPTSLPTSFQAMPVGGAPHSNVEVVVPSVNSDRTDLRISNDCHPRPFISYGKSNVENAGTKIIRNSASFELPISPDEESLRANETVTTIRKDEASSQAMPIVRVTPSGTNDVPLAKVIPQNYCLRETRHEIAVAHSAPSKCRVYARPFTPNPAVGRGRGHQLEHKAFPSVSVSQQQSIPSKHVMLEGNPISAQPLTTWIGRGRGSNPPPVRITEVQKYPGLLSDVNQIHRTCVTPPDLPREPIEVAHPKQTAQCAKTSLVECFDSATRASNPISSKNKASWGDPRRPPLAHSSGKKVVYANPQLHVPEIIKSTRIIENSATSNMRVNLQGILNSENPWDSTTITPRSLDDCLDIIPTREFSSLSVERGETICSQSDPSKVENRYKLKRSASFSPAHSMVESLRTKERYIMHTLVMDSEEVEKLDPIPERLVGTTVASKALCKEIDSLLRPAVASSYTKSKPNFPLRETRDFSTSTDNTVTVVCHGTQTGLFPASSGPDVSSNPSLLGAFPRQQKFAQITVSPTILDSFTDRLTTLSTSSVVQHPSSSLSLLGGDEGEQKSHEQPDGLSTLTLWNQIRHSLVELSSISEEGGLPPPQKQATATVKLERSRSALARANTTGSLSPCISRVGTDLSELNADVTGLSEPTLSSLSVPENFGSAIPWTRAKLVMLPGATIKSARSIPAAVLAPCQLVSRSSQTNPHFTELPSKVVFNKGDLQSVQRTPAEVCQKTAIHTRNSSSQISMRSPVRVDNSDSPPTKSENSTSRDNNSKPSSHPIRQPPVAQGSEVAVQTEAACFSSQTNEYGPIISGVTTSQLSRSLCCAAPKFHSSRDAPENCMTVPHGNNISTEATLTNRKEAREKPKILKYPNVPANGNRISGSRPNQMPDKFIPLPENPVLGRERGRMGQQMANRRNAHKEESRSESARLNRSVNRRRKYEEPQRKSFRPRHKAGDKENARLKPKWNSVYSPNRGRMSRTLSRRWRYADPGGETDTSDVEENSPPRGVRPSFPRPARTKRIHNDEDFSPDNRSQVPTFERIRLQKRRNETAYLPVKPGITQSRVNKGFKEPRSNSLSESRESRKSSVHHSSMPHLLRVPGMYTPESPRAQVWNRLSSQAQPHTSLVQNEQAREYQKTLNSLQIRKHNSRRPKYKVQRNSTVCEDSACFRNSSTHHTFPHPFEHDRHLDPGSQRRLVKRVDTFDACNNGACLISTLPIRRGSLSFSNSTGYNTANAQGCGKYFKKFDPFLGFHTERRTEDNLLRHTFASLQKVRTKAAQMMPVNSRPPMVFK